MLTDKLLPVKKNEYTCPYCDEKFDVLKNLVIHRRIHKSQAKLKCSMCDYYGVGRESLIFHYKHDHFFTIENESLQFDSFEDFQLWKQKVEEESYASFINRSGKKKTRNTTL